MATSRLPGQRGDGSAVVRGWVALYTLGLPGLMRARRRDEVAGDLADETHDAIRRGEVADLRRRRLIRWALGIPSDLTWRFIDAPPVGRRIRAGQPATPWVPVSRGSLLLLAIAAIGAAGGLGIVLVPLATGQAGESVWSGWGMYGFIAGCVAVLAGVLLSVPWPRRAVAITVGGVIIGMLAAPWLWGCWLLGLFAVGARWYQASLGVAESTRTLGPGSSTRSGGAR